MAAIKLKTDFQKSHALKVLQETPVGQRLELIIRKEKRSNPQNNLFHKWCTEIARESGGYYTMEEVKIAMKKLYGVWEAKTVCGEEVTVMKSTAKYNTTEMSELMSGVASFAGEHGLELSNPDDLGAFYEVA